MANIQINIVENGTTTLATSGCICDRNIDINVDVPTTGGGSAECDKMHIDEKYLCLSGSGTYKFYGGGWDWFLDEYGDKITTQNISSSDMMFNGSSATRLPFSFNFESTAYTQFQNCSGMFRNMSKVEEIGDIVNLSPNNMDEFFMSCQRLRYLPNFINLDLSYMQASTSNKYLDSMFQNCYSLREIPESLLNKLYTPNLNSYYYSLFYNGFSNCYALDEIVGLMPITGTITSNMFGDTFRGCYRVKDIIFATQEDGTPYTANWKSQTIELSNYIGYMANGSYIRQYNSGITEDKMANNDTAYQALKNDPDWFTTYPSYSRYNKESAWRTIQSLPDTSAYLASVGGTNTIKFLSNSGYNTDGGQIYDLTEEQVAVAAAKGWTVSFIGTPMGGDIGSGSIPT